MQKNILILGLGAFGFAIAKHLGENNPQQIFHASEVNSEIFSHISQTRKHPYFFEGVILPENIELVENADLRSLLQKTDIIISVIPCQFTDLAFREMKDTLKKGVVILNLSKGIDNQSLETISEKLNSLLNPLPYKGKGATNFYFTYAYLAGGMIAEEVIQGKNLGADIVTENAEIGEYLKQLFHSETLDINLKIGNPKNTELAAALKNIVALILGYYEGQGAGASTLGYYFAKLLREMQGVIEILHRKPHRNSSPQGEDEATKLKPLSPGGERIQDRGFAGEKQIDLTSYALSGDLIATCFGNSRNRLLGNMLGKGASLEDALGELRAQKKIAEGYETLKGIKFLIEGKEGFEEINKFGGKYL